MPEPVGTPILSEAELEAQRQTEVENNSSGEPTPPISPNPSPNPPTNPEYLTRLEETLRQNTEIMRQMNERLATPPRNESVPAPVAPTQEEENAEFYSNPAGFQRRVLTEHLDRTIKPIQEFVDGFKSEKATDDTLAEFRTHPKFAPLWDNVVENAVRRQIASLPAGKVTKQVISQAVVNAIGLKATGLLEGSSSSTPTPNPTPRDESVPNNPPPAIRPSNPAPPSNNTKDKEPVLTEQERTMMRENKQTAKEYAFWRDLPADKLTKAKWDKKTQTGTVG